MKQYYKALSGLFSLALVLIGIQLFPAQERVFAQAGLPASPLSLAAEDTLARIRREGVLRWASDSSGGAPFVFFDPKNPSLTIGFEKEIMDELARHLGVRHEIVEVRWEVMINNLLSRRCDVALNGIEITPDRMKVVGFTQPYYVYEQMLTVRQGDREKYRSLADLKGRIIGTLSGSESNNVLKRAGFSEDQLLGHEDSLTPYSNLKLGRVDAVMQENIIAAFYANPEKAPTLYNIPETFSPGKYAIAMRQEDTSLIEALDKALDAIKRNGALAAIYKKWGIWTPSQKGLGITENTGETDSGQKAPQAEPMGLYQYLFEYLALGDLIRAAKYPLFLTIASMPLAILFGLLFALMRMSKSRFFSWPSAIYTEIVRGTPLLVQIFLIYYTLPRLGQAVFHSDFLTFNSPLTCGIICLTANYAAYQAEIIRAGLEAVDKGQQEAALAIGLTDRQTLTLIVIPQAFRIVIPPIINDFIAMLKDSCLTSVIGVPELLNRAAAVGKSRFNLEEMYIAASILYMIMSLAFYFLGKWLENRLRLKGAPELQSDVQHGH